MIKILESQNAFGVMNTKDISYDNLTYEDRKFLCEKYHIDISGFQDYIKNMPSDIWKANKKEIFKTHRIKFGETMGINWKHMFMADQDVKKSGSRGSSFEITKDYVEANPNGWSDIAEDLLVIKNDVPGVVIGHPVADCPVVMMVDQKQKIAIVGHCSGALIDEKLPMMISETLRSKYDSRLDDIFTYVSACAGDTWTYDSKPGWASDNDFWRDYIIYNPEDKLFHINLRAALLEQFIKSGLDTDNMRFNLDDTITDTRYYSNSMQRINPSRGGRHFAGLCFDGIKDDSIILLKPDVLVKKR